MHIVYVCREYPPSLRGGGIASYIKEIAHGMHRRGHQVTVVAASDDTRKESEEMDDGVRVLRLKGGDFVIPSVENSTNKLLKLRELYRFRSYRKRIRRVIQSLYSVDIIEVPEFGAEGLYLSGLAIPMVVRLHTPSLFDRDTQEINTLSLHNAFRYWQQWKEFEIVKESKYITCCSDSLRQWFYNNVANIKAEIEVIYNPVDLNLNQEIVSAANKGNPFILFAGTIVDVKGVEDLIKASIIMHNQGDCHELIIAGKEGEFADYLKKSYSEYGWIRFSGKLPKGELYALYRQADVVCLPSWWDNLPMACLEAMMNRAVVVAGSEGGMSEIIENGVNGFLVEPKNPELLSIRIAEVLSLEGKERIRDAAYSRIKNAFASDVVVSAMEDYYKKVIMDFKRNTK